MECISFEVQKMACSGLLQLSSLRLCIGNEKRPAYSAKVAIKCVCACVCVSFGVRKDWND